MQKNTSQSRPLSEKTAERIRQYIEENGLKIGDKLPNEFQLAEICGVGRSTIREAVKILVFEQYVEIVRGSGTFVSEPISIQEDPMGLTKFKNDFKTALNFFEVRLMLEPEIASLAAANATYEDCQKLLELCEAVEQLISKGESHLDADVAFHNQIAVCSKNNIASNVMEVVTKGVSYFVMATGNSLAHETYIYHRKIAESIVAGDSVGARCHMITHLNGPRSLILKKLENGEEA
ncbi:MAG: FadR/GntR family transcriptional regulator [Lacrimispora sp.]|uniref:FadR/GntR family transcriptional regulator n=1 Tax=Lacrimispora sp. TaxID=2719234 RepID=UPI0039E28CF2